MIEVVVLGAGPAGCSAAVQCRRLGMGVRLFDASGQAGGLIREARLIENYPGLEKPLPGGRFSERLSSHLSRFDIEVEKARAGSIETEEDGFSVRFAGATVAAMSVVVATGTTPKPFSLPGVPPAYIIRSVLDLPEPLPGRVLIVGAGEAAFDYALNVADRGGEAVILARGPSVKATGKIKKQVESDKRVRIVYNAASVSATRAENGGVFVHSPHGRRLFEKAGGIVLAATGREPALPEMPREFNHSVTGVRTSVPGLFVAGDVWLGCTGQAGIAVGQGLLAARYAQVYVNTK